MMIPLMNVLSIQTTLSPFHPLLIEGPTSDPRDPSIVAANIVLSLRHHWKTRNISKPILLITQGDPLTETGISAITRRVADGLDVKRCLVTLDAHIDKDHSVLADRHDVVYELKYSQLVDVINNFASTEDDKLCTTEQSPIDSLTNAIDNKIFYKTEKRKDLGQGPLSPWVKQYALLQEVTKLGFKRICGEITIVHTYAKCDIPEFGVTSFYEVGLEMGWINEEMDMVEYLSATL